MAGGPRGPEPAGEGGVGEEGEGALAWPSRQQRPGVAEVASEPPLQVRGQPARRHPQMKASRKRAWPGPRTRALRGR